MKFFMDRGAIVSVQLTGEHYRQSIVQGGIWKSLGKSQ